MVTDQFVFAILTAVETKEAFANPYFAAGLTGAFTGAIAKFAIGAFSPVFADTPDGKPTKDAEQSTKGTNESTVESWDNEVEKDSCEENKKNEPARLIKARCCRDNV